MSMRVTAEPKLTEEAAGTRRERSKAARRLRIVEAAYALLREIDMDAISVKTIADRADVSAATVYNLFGTKAAVLGQVYERDFLAFEDLVAAAGPHDALDLIFAAVSIAADQYRADPRFYRAILAVRDPAAGAQQATSAHRAREAFWTRRVGEAMSEGLLRTDTNAQRLAVVLIQISAGALSHWISSLITVDELERETAYGFAAALSSFAGAEALGRLRERLRALEKPAAPAASPAQRKTAPTREVEAA